MDELGIGMSSSQQQLQYSLVRFGSNIKALKSQRAVIINHLHYQQEHYEEIKRWENDVKEMKKQKEGEIYLSRA